MIHDLTVSISFSSYDLDRRIIVHTAKHLPLQICQNNLTEFEPDFEHIELNFSWAILTDLDVCI